MTNYELIFTRWNKKKSERMRSSRQHFHAENFAAAYEYASTILRGMRDMTEDDIEIESLRSLSTGASIICNGVGAWEIINFEEEGAE